VKVAAEHRIASESIRSRHDIDVDTSDIAAAFGAVLAQVAARTEPTEPTSGSTDTVAATDRSTGTAAAETEPGANTAAEATTTDVAASQPTAVDGAEAQAPGAEVTADGEAAGVMGEIAAPGDPDASAITAAVEPEAAMTAPTIDSDAGGDAPAIVSGDASKPDATAVDAATVLDASAATGDEAQPTITAPAADAPADGAQSSPAPAAPVQPTRAPTPAAAIVSSDTAAPTAQPDIPSPTAQLVNVLAPLRARANGSTHLTLSLRPDDLGQVDVEFRIERGTVHLALRAEQAGTATLLREGLGDLRGQLQEHGITTGDMSVGEHAHREESHRDESAEVDHRSDDEAAVAAIDPLTTDADALVDVRM
jgi:flagellar hook-length control protein FliK